jgi:hypothetical protein
MMEIHMPFIVINGSNSFDPNNQVEYASEAEADAKAREILGAFPQSLIRTAQLVKTYRAQVTITAEDVPEQDQPTE